MNPGWNRLSDLLLTELDLSVNIMTILLGIVRSVGSNGGGRPWDGGMGRPPTRSSSEHRRGAMLLNRINPAETSARQC